MNEIKMERRAVFLLAATALLVLSAGLGFREIESGDETRAAGIAAETFFGGTPLVPRLNGTPFLEYPPLHAWLTAGSYTLFGVCDFAAKFPSALAAFALVMLTYAFARKLKFSVREALFSGMALLFSSQFFPESRTCRVDMVLAFFIALSLYGFYAMTREERRWETIGYWALFALGLAGGIYTKGLIGIVLPGSVIGSWIVIGDLLGRSWTPRRWIGAFTGGVLALGMAGIWYALLWHAEGKEMFDTVFWTNNLGRFAGTQTDHAESVFYYFQKLPTLFLPWLPILLAGLAAIAMNLRAGRNRELLYPFLGILLPFALLCAASGKRMVYLLPLSVPCALVTGWYLGHLPRRIRQLAKKIPLRKAGMALLLLAMMTTIGIDLVTAQRMNRKKSLRPLFEACAALEKQGRQVVLIDAAERTEGAACFYLQHRLPERKSTPAGPERNECWVLRRKENKPDGQLYADHHLLLDGSRLPSPGRIAARTGKNDGTIRTAAPSLPKGN